LAKSAATAGAIVSIAAGAVTWFVLDVILGVAVWISFVAGGGLALAGAILAIGAGAARAGGGRRSHSGSPLGVG
jgi:hypothetical protein